MDDRDRELVKRPSQSMRTTIDSTTVNQHPAQSATATSAVIIPNKSTIEEEYIDIPYGRDGRDSGFEERHGGPGDEGHESASDYPSALSTRSPPAGLGGLAARLKTMDEDDDVQGRGGDDAYDKLGRPVDASRSSSRITGGRTSVSDDAQKMRTEYEYKIAAMQIQISNMQRDLNNATDAEKLYQDSERRAKQLEEDLSGFRQVISFHPSILSFTDDQMLTFQACRGTDCYDFRFTKGAGRS